MLSDDDPDAALCFATSTPAIGAPSAATVLNGLAGFPPWAKNRHGPSSIVSGQRIHDRALGPTAGLALVDQGAQRPIQPLEVGDLTTNLVAMLDRHVARLLAAGTAFVETNEVADRLQCEPQFPPPPDEIEAADMHRQILAIPAGTAIGLGQQDWLNVACCLAKILLVPVVATDFNVAFVSRLDGRVTA